MANIKVKLVKSLIGSKKDQIATANSLGLRKIGDVAIQPDNAQTKGKIRKIKTRLNFIYFNFITTFWAYKSKRICLSLYHI